MFDLRISFFYDRSSKILSAPFFTQSIKYLRKGTGFTNGPIKTMGCMEKLSVNFKQIRVMRICLNLFNLFKFLTYMPVYIKRNMVKINICKQIYSKVDADINWQNNLFIYGKNSKCFH